MAAAANASSVNAAQLQELQSRARRDPEAYGSEVKVHVAQLARSLDVIAAQAAQAAGGPAGAMEGGAEATTSEDALAPLLTFLGYVGATHAALCRPLAPRLETVLVAAAAGATATAAAVPPPLRLAMLKALCILRTRNCYPPNALASLLVRLGGAGDKPMRRQCHHQLVAEVRNSTRGATKDVALSRHVRSLLRRQLTSGDGPAARRAVGVAVKLYRTGSWRDADTVALLVTAADHADAAAARSAVRFFLGRDEEEAGGEGGDDDLDSEDEGNDARNRRGAEENKANRYQFITREDVYKATKKGTVSTKKKKQKKLDRAVRSMQKQAKREEDGTYLDVASGDTPRFAALELLRDPQQFAERLFRRCTRGAAGGTASAVANGRFAAADVPDAAPAASRAGGIGVNVPSRPLSFADRLLCFQLACRVVGIHKLLLLGLYSYSMKYAKPHQREVTQLLTAAIHATHDLTPPEHVAPLLRHIADNFVSEKSSGAAMVVGLQAVRELCSRCPTAIDGDLLRDLVTYKDYKKGERGIAMAAKGLLSLYRDVAPALLERRDRGLGAAAAAAAKKREVTAAVVASKVEGAAGGAALSEKVRAGMTLEERRQIREAKRQRKASKLEIEEALAAKAHVRAYGEKFIAHRIAGIDLLVEEKRKEAEGDDGDSDEDVDDDDDVGGGDDDGELDFDEGEDLDEDEEEDEEEDDGEEGEEEEEEEEEEDDDDDEEGEEDEEEEDDIAVEGAAKKPKLEADPTSLRALKTQLAQKAAAAAVAAEEEEDPGEANLPYEAKHLLDQSDLRRLRDLRRQAFINEHLRRNGLNPDEKDDESNATGRVSKRKRERLVAEAEESAEKLLARGGLAALASSGIASAAAGAVHGTGDAPGRRIDAEELLAGYRERSHSKKDRLATVHAGREDRGEFGAKTSRKRAEKTAGLSNREKAKKKAMPVSVRVAKARQRANGKRKAAPGARKQFGGKKGRDRRR